MKVRILTAITSIAAVAAQAAEPTAGDDAFFETKVQPVLVKRCYECHSHDKKIKGGLALDPRTGFEQ